MKNRDLILMLIDKSINSFGQIHGLTEEDKLKSTLTITQSAIQDSFDINSNDLSKKVLADILAKGKLNMEQVQQLIDLLWTQAEIFLKLNQPQDSLTHYKNALQLLHWQIEQTVEKNSLERKNKIKELEAIIATLKVTDTIQ